jgi:hypothetical protein
LTLVEMSRAKSMRRNSLILSTCLVVRGAALAHADDVGAAKELADRRLAYATGCADQYEFQAPAGGDVRRLSGPLLRWSNEVVREEDAVLFLWVRDQRPLAAAQFFLQDGAWHHEFQSLCDRAFEARCRDGGSWSWTPQRPGIEFAAAEGAPAASKPLRLRQMKGIAERFRAATHPNRENPSADPHELRLLTTPVYRYTDEAAGIVDGALFACCQGTNPELLIAVEAQAAEGKAAAWRYAFAAMTSFRLQVWEGSRLAWEIGQQDVPTRDRREAYNFRWKAAVDRSTESTKKVDVLPATNTAGGSPVVP